MEPLKPLKPLGAPQGIKPLSPVKPVQVEKVKLDDEGSFDKLFGGPATSPKVEAPKEESKDIKEVATNVAKQMVDSVKNKVEEVTKGKGKGKGKAKSENEDGEEESTPKASAKKTYDGPRHVKVYGQLLFTENDPKVSLEAIRKRIVEEYGFEEYSESRTTMSLDEETGIVIPNISFQKKG